MGWPVLAADTTNEQIGGQCYALVCVEPPVSPKIALGGEQYAGNCVMYAKFVTGHLNESWGIPKKMVPTSPIPYVGGIVITTEGPVGHVAVITKIEDSVLYLKEANYVPSQITTRVLKMDSPVIRGYR